MCSGSGETYCEISESYYWQRDLLLFPLNSLDIAPSDYHLFLDLKRCLQGQCFKSDAKVKG